MLTKKSDTAPQKDNNNDSIVIQFGIKDGKIWSKNNQNLTTRLDRHKGFTVFKYDVNEESDQLAFCQGFIPGGGEGRYVIHLVKDCQDYVMAEPSQVVIPKKWLSDGITVFLSKSNENQLTLKKGINQSDLIFSGNQTSREFILRTEPSPISLSTLSSSHKQKTCFHIKKDDTDAIWIRSNQSLKSEKNDNALLYLSHSKQFFGKRELIIDELGALQKDGSFKLDQNATQFSAEDIKKGMTFILKNGKFTWHSEIIPFEELEDPEEEMNDFSFAPEPAPLMDYDPATETQSETETSFFSSLSNNKTTVVCATTGLAIAAVLAHVLGGHNYLAQTDSWSLWSPGGLNALALRSLPQNVLLEKLHQEIAYRYGNGPDRIATFLKEIKEEIHQLNLCNWSYSSLCGLYLLPKIQSFENISQRIQLLEMFIYTIEQEMANKAVQSLR